MTLDSIDDKFHRIPLVSGEINQINHHFWVFKLLLIQRMHFKILPFPKVSELVRKTSKDYSAP